MHAIPANSTQLCNFEQSFSSIKLTLFVGEERHVGKYAYDSISRCEVARAR
jgi:hypothetical protein